MRIGKKAETGVVAIRILLVYLILIAPSLVVGWPHHVEMSTQTVGRSGCPEIPFGVIEKEKLGFLPLLAKKTILITDPTANAQVSALAFNEFDFLGTQVSMNVEGPSYLEISSQKFGIPVVLINKTIPMK